MKKMTATIKKRTSCRNYLDITIEKDKIDKINEMFNEKGPFDNNIKFDILNFEGFTSEDTKSYGSYGIVKNDKHFVVGITEKKANALTDFGYCMEKIVLNLTKMGFATCWLGGTFSREIFSQKYQIKENEIIPAIVVFGHASDKNRFVDSAIKFFANSKHRKPLEEIFLSKTPNPR